MKKIMTLVLAVSAAAGCAATAPAVRGDVNVTQLQELQTENDVLVKILVMTKLAERQREFGLVSPTNRTLATAPTVKYAAKPFPKHLARLDRAAGGCASGTAVLEIGNESIFYLKLAVDGEAVTVLGGDHVAEIIKPQQKVFLCPGAGAHVITGTAYVAKDTIMPPASGQQSGELVELGKFERQLNVGTAEASSLVVNTRDLVLPVSLR